jgi:pimeloyl-ACP methyl ester carboxylesterase
LMGWTRSPRLTSMFTTHNPAPGLRSIERWAGLTGRRRGELDASGRSLVLVHGLTFDHRMWDPIIDALPANHSVLALDLPGHGDSPALASHYLEDVVDAIHEAVLAAALDAPILVGHSLGAGIAGTYIAKHPAAAFVNVDSPVRIEPFVRMLRSLGPQLRGDAFSSVWQRFEESMHIELLSPAAQALLRPAETVAPELVLSYWAQLLDEDVHEYVSWVDAQLRRAGAARIPYLAVYGAAVDPAERAWVQQRLPQAETIVWPVGHHFPHLAHPDRFAALLTGLAAGLPPLPFAEADGPARQRPQDLPEQRPR